MHLGIITPSIISLDLPERKLPLSHGGLNGANKTRATDNLNTTLPQLISALYNVVGKYPTKSTACSCR